MSCYPWSSYVLAKDCVSTSLANNGWAAASQLPNMTENERKSLLLAKLSFHYNRTVHTEFELSNRKVRKSTYKLLNLPHNATPTPCQVSSSSGSLCGLAAVYQAAVGTTLTVFQVVMSSDR